MQKDNLARIHAISELKSAQGKVAASTEKSSLAHEKEIQALESDHTKTLASIASLDKKEGVVNKKISHEK